MSHQLTGRAEQLFLLSGGFLIIGLFYSRFITTVATLSICSVCLWFFRLQKAKKVLYDWKIMPFTLVFVSVLISYFYSENQAEMLTALRVKLPFIALPICFFFLPGIREKTVLYLHIWFIAAVVIVGIPVFLYGVKNYDYMLDLISIGQSIPAPIEHVKYSMINAYGAVTGMCILLFKYRKMNRTELFFLSVGVVFITILLHFLAVRTGIAIFYVSMFGLGLIWCYVKKSIRGLIVLIFLLVTIPFMAYQAIPSVKQKVGYMLYDWSKDEIQYSDSKRIHSARMAWKIIKSEPFFGVGYGDVRDEVKRRYQEESRREELDILPHSQFLLVMSGAGLIGLLLFLTGLYIPLWNSISLSLNGMLLGLLYLNFSMSYFVENSLERSVSVAFFLFFALVLIKGEGMLTLNETP